MSQDIYIYISFCSIHDIVACVALIFHSAQNSSIEIEESGMGKKSKKTTMPTTPPAAGLAVVDPTGKNKGLISDTTCLGLPKTTWQGIYNLIEAEGPMVTEVEILCDNTSKSDANLKDLAIPSYTE